MHTSPLEVLRTVVDYLNVMLLLKILMYDYSLYLWHWLYGSSGCFGSLMLAGLCVLTRIIIQLLFITLLHVMLLARLVLML